MRIEVGIVTHDDPSAADRCVRSVRGQSISPDRICVVDTAGDRPVMDSTKELDRRVVVRRLLENSGPGGGWAAVLQEFQSGTADAAWLLDDDCVPRPDALAESLAALKDADVVQATMVDSQSGAIASTQGWCGVLIARHVVEAVGVPDEQLVWWTEDTEYLQWRIPRAGFRVVRSEQAIVEVSLRPERAPKPPWKYYYEARNQVAYRIRTQRPDRGQRNVPRHLTTRVRWWRAARSVSKLCGRALVVEQQGRLTKFSMSCRGAVHGLRGITGLTVPLSSPDRARTSTVDRPV